VFFHYKIPASPVCGDSAVVVPLRQLLKYIQGLLGDTEVSMQRIWLACLVGAAALWAQTPARNTLNDGVAAFKAGKYQAAIELFRQAVNANPSDATPHLYLATAFMQQYVPGRDSAENEQFATDAEHEFRAVLDLQPDNLPAMNSIASLHFNRASSKKNMDEKTRGLQEAEYWYKKILAVAPNEKTAHYSLGVIAWSRFYPQLMQARSSLGMRPEDPGPLSNAAIRADLRSRAGVEVEEGMRHLQRALELDPEYDDAMAYLNLLYRERGDLAESAEDYQRDVQTADTFVHRALEIKKAKAERNAAAHMSGAPAPTGTAGAASSERPPAPKQIRVGGAVMAQKLIQQPQPEYPAAAAQARIQGTVRFDVTILHDGTIGNLSLVSGHPLLVPAAHEAVMRWRYRPTLLNGEPVEVVTQIDVNFNLR
jgi:TonB family protein